MPGQVGVRIPAVYDPAHVETVRMHRHQSPRGDERLHFDGLQPPGLDVQVQAVCCEELVRVIVVQFGALMAMQGVFDGEVVQPQFVFELGENLRRRGGEVDPQRGSLLREALGNFGQWQLGRIDRPIAVQPGSDHAGNVSRGGAADNLGTAFLATDARHPQRAGGGMSGKKFGDYSFVVVSNRLPSTAWSKTDGAAYWQQSPGGLVTALEPVMRAHDGAWVGWAGAAGPRASSRSTATASGSSLCRSARKRSSNYYEGFSNETLWPLYHDVIAPPATAGSGGTATSRSIGGSPRPRPPRSAEGAVGVGARLPAAAGAADAARAARPTSRSDSSTTSRSRRTASTPSCRGALRSSRASSAPTSSASSAPRMPATSPARCAG